MSRMYISFRDKSKSQHYVDKLRDIWKDKDILIVEGEYTRSGVGNDLFENAKVNSANNLPSCGCF